ncbi:MAG: T9SS type A sorting domain-containing protein [Salinivirgaceae bacterium]|jgi:hypothetical protein|nr:T9SS type A sorting domain-containing protein [Salinivirgaceae bacterium]
MRKLTLFFVAFMCIGFTINAQIDLQEGLVAHYPFNSNANDESGNGDHGFVNGATLVPDRFDNVNSAFNFDGYNDYIECGGDAIFDGSVSVSLWVYFDEVNFSEVKRIMGKGLASDIDVPGWSINLLESNKINFFWEDYEDTNNSISSSVELEALEYYHLVLTIDPVSSEYKIYINNNLEATGTMTNPPMPNNDNLLIGARIVEAGMERYMDGSIDDIRIYDRTVNEQEVQALYGEGQPLPIVENESGCEGSTIPSLTASGQNIKWYANENLTYLLFEGNDYSTGETTAGTYTYYVTQTIDAIESQAVEVTLTINNSIPNDPVAPSGPSEICTSTIESYYTVNESAGTDSYIWQITPDDAGTIAGTSNTGTVSWNEMYSGEAQISVIAVNSCGQSNASEDYLVTVNQGAYVTSLLNQVAELESQLSTANDSIIVLNNILDEPLDSIMTLNNMLADANDSIMLLNNTLTDANDSIILLNTTLTEANDSIILLNTTLTEANDSIILLNTTLTEANDSITTLNNQLTIANETIEDLQAQIAALQNGYAINGEQIIDITTSETYDYQLIQDENQITEQVNWILTDVDNTVIQNTVANEFAIMADELANGEYWLFCRYNNEFVGMQKITASDEISIANTNEQTIEIFPNPTKSILNITGLADNSRIKVYNNSGSLVLEKENDLSSINVSGLTSGSYYLNVYSGKELVTSKKFIKK